MKKMNEQQLMQLREQAKQYMNLRSEGKTVEETMAQIYMDAFNGENKEAAIEMAGKAMQAVKGFAKNYQAAAADLDKYLIDFQNKMDEGKTNTEKCSFWMNFISAMITAQMEGEQEDRQKVLAEISALEINEETATDELVAHLRDVARDAVKNNNLMFTDLEKQIEALESMGEGNEAAELLLGLNDDENELRALTAMLAYISIKQGNIKGMPADVSIEQVATMVCAGHERVKILTAVQLGKLAETAATMLLTILGALVIADSLCLGFVVVGTMLMTYLTPIPGALLFVLLLPEFFEALYEVVKTWSDISKVIVKTTSVLVRKVIEGARKLLAYAKRVVLSKVVPAAKNMVKRLRELYAQKQQAQQTQQAQQVTA